ncbi:hypothetical protein [Oceanobacillus sp. SE10311]|uniref:hypothetical protein n=1 Tax=Oceanobacillus sp. SE10311 TaxID=3098289 RepID=UPI00300DD2C3
MVNYKLIPFYREKELYTLFYDHENSHMYKLQHGKKSFAMFYLVILAVLLGSQYLDRIYQVYKGPFVNTIFIAAFIIGYIIAKMVYDNYYIQDTKRKVIFDGLTLQEFAMKAKKQFRIEIYVCLFGVIVAILCFALFFSINRIQPLLIGFFSISALFIILFMKPFRRLKMLNGFIENEISIK